MNEINSRDLFVLVLRKVQNQFRKMMAWDCVLVSTTTLYENGHLVNYCYPIINRVQVFAHRLHSGGFEKLLVFFVHQTRCQAA